MNVTIRDIAKKAEVSKSTVSRVLSKNGYVSKDARRKVEEAIWALNFVPSAMAQGLSNNVANTIAVLFPEIENNFFTEVLGGISEVVDKNDITLILSDTSNDVRKQAKALQMIRSQRVKGLIITPAIEFLSMEDNSKFLDQLDQLNMPIVIVDRDIPDSRWDTIMFENFKAGYLAAKALLEAGRTNIGIITGDMTLSIARERFKGFEYAMKEAAIELNYSNVLKGDFSSRTAVAITEKMFNRKTNKLDGIVCSNNQTSIGFMHVIMRDRIKLGQNFGVIGIDHVRMFEELSISFSHIKRDTRLMGRLAVEKLMEQIDNPGKLKEIYPISAELVSEGTE